MAKTSKAKTVDLPKSTQRRLVQMNRQLFPCRMRYRKQSGAFQFSYRRNGKEIWKSLGKDLETAYERALILAQEVNSGIPLVSKSSMSLDTWYEKWSEEKYQKLAPKTVANYKYCWSKIPEELRELDLASIDEEAIKLVLAGIATNGTRDHVSRFLSILLNGATKAGHIQKSPWTYTHKRNKKIIPMVSVDMMIRICECASDSTRPAIAIGMFCGLRLGEVMALTVQDVDLEHRILYVQGGCTRLYGEEAIDEMGDTKTGDPRPSPIPDPAVPFIRPALEDKEPGALLFPTFRGDINKRLKNACKAAGASRLSFHDLRHVCATRLIQSGGMAFAQAVLGHTEIGTTVDTYGHLDILWMQKKMEAAFIDPELQALKLQADALVHHADPTVRSLAEKTSSICVKLCQEN